MKRAYFALLSAPLAIAAMALPAPVMAATGISSFAISPAPVAASSLLLDAADSSADLQRRYRRGDYYGNRNARENRRERRAARREYRRDQRLSRNSRVWRDRNDGRYYCQRDDGTTGLLIGGAVGGLLGNEVAGRGDKLLGTVLGAAGGALLGKHIDRSNYSCR